MTNVSKLTVVTENKKTTGKIEDVTLCYIKLQEGSYKYQSKTEKEYTLDVVVDKATAKEFKKQFPKNGYKEFENIEFQEKFKIDPPYPEQEEQFVIKLKAAAELKTDAPKAGLKEGDTIPYEWSSRPKLFIPVEGGVEDVTMTVLASNGSKGDVAFNVTTNDFGTFPQLTGVLVKELVAYENNSGATSAFGTVVGGYKADTSKAEQKADVGEPEDIDDSAGANQVVSNSGDKLPF